MTDENPSAESVGLTRRQVLASTGAGALVGLAGCGGGGIDDCSVDTSFSKEAESEFRCGEEAVYSFELCNNGSDECTGELVIEDNLPDGITFVDVSGDWSNSGSPTDLMLYNSNIDSASGLEGGDCLSAEVTVEVDGTSQFNGGPPTQVENCAELVINDEVRNEDCVRHELICEEPCRLTLEKGTAGEFQFGQQATYTFEICNQQEEECAGPLTIEEDLPDGISFVGVTGNWMATVSGGVVTATNDSYGGLGPGDCLTVEMTVEVAPVDEFPGEPPVENCATLSQFDEVLTESCVTHDIVGEGDQCPPVAFDLNSGYDQANEATLVDGADDPDWQLTQDGSDSGPVPRPATVADSDVEADLNGSFPESRWISHRTDADVEVGDSFVYEYCFCLRDGFHDPELTLQIQADDEIVDIQLNGTSVAFSGGGQFQGDPIEETYTDPGLFEAGDNCLTLVLDDTQGVTAAVNVVGTMAAENADCGCDPGGVEPECILSIEKSITGEFYYGEQHQAGYVYEVCNDGNGECSGELHISDPLPDGISGPVVPSSGMTGSVTSGVFEGTIQYSGLAPGNCLTRELLVTVGDADAFAGDSPHEVENCAELLEDEQAVSADCVRHEVPAGEPSGSCDLTLTKETGEQFYFGEEGSYIFTVCNDGEQECTAALEVSDAFPDGISFVEVSGGWSASVVAGVVTVTNDSYGGLTPGDCLEFEIIVEVAPSEEFPSDTDRVTNCATLDHGGQTEDEDCEIHSVQRPESG